MSGNVYQIVTDRIIEKLQAGTVPWRQPWQGAELGACKNLISQKPYRGINAFLTAVAGHRSPYWLTYKQAKELGAHVKAGEKGTPIVYLGQAEKQKDGADEPEKFSFLRYYTAFNVEQVERLRLSPALLFPDNKPKNFEPIAACESIVAKMPMIPRIQHAEPRAYYSPTLDYINMPDRTSFHDASGYYATLFHELTHSTGHESRVDRGLSGKLAAFGSADYSKEELVAEMGSAFLCSKSGIETVTLDNSASYIQGWLKALKGDPRLLVQAAAQAQKAAEFILGIKQE